MQTDIGIRHIDIFFLVFDNLMKYVHASIVACTFALAISFAKQSRNKQLANEKKNRNRKCKAHTHTHTFQFCQ